MSRIERIDEQTLYIVSPINSEFNPHDGATGLLALYQTNLHFNVLLLIFKLEYFCDFE